MINYGQLVIEMKMKGSPRSSWFNPKGEFRCASSTRLIIEQKFYTNIVKLSFQVERHHDDPYLFVIFDKLVND